MRWNCLKNRKIIPSNVPYSTSSSFHPSLPFSEFLRSQNLSHRRLPFDLEYERTAEGIHVQLVKNGSYASQFEANHLLDLYARSQRPFPVARRLFDDIPHPDVRTWTILISTYARTGHFGTALVMFRRMRKEGTFPNRFVLASGLKCCSRLRELKSGKEIHGWVLKHDICLDVVLQNAILDMYAKCAALGCASNLFKLMESKSTISWNMMISGYLSVGDVKRSIEIFEALKLKDVVTWNAMIDGLIRLGVEKLALEMLYRMVADNTKLNGVTLAISLNLASSLSDLQLGKQIHVCILKDATMDDPFLGSSLIDMYCKCGKMDNAFSVFRNLPLNCYWYNPLSESVLWSSMVSGYVRNNKFENAIQLFRFMIAFRAHLDKFTVTSLLSACGKIGSLELGRQIHGLVQKNGQNLDAYMCSSLIDMYSKCGYLDDARLVFHLHNSQNVVLWTSIICGCASNGKGMEAIELFNVMIEKKIKPNNVTFVGVLTACSRMGMVEEGIKYFNLMQQGYGINPMADHYTSMVDIYGRAGRLSEARTFILMHNLSSVVTVLKSLLTFSKLYKDLAMEKWVSESLLDVESCDTNPSAKCHNMDNSNKARKFITPGNIAKVPGQSWIHVKDLANTCG